jgi:ferredoxin
MKIEFDQYTCTGMFQCVHEWEWFEKNLKSGKADLRGAVEGEENIFSMEVPEGQEFEAEMAARVCPVDAIKLYGNDGERIV